MKDKTEYWWCRIKGNKYSAPEIYMIHSGISEQDKKPYELIWGHGSESLYKRSKLEFIRKVSTDPTNYEIEVSIDENQRVKCQDDKRKHLAWECQNCDAFICYLKDKVICTFGCKTYYKSLPQQTCDNCADKNCKEKNMLMPNNCPTWKMQQYGILKMTCPAWDDPCEAEVCDGTVKEFKDGKCYSELLKSEADKKEIEKWLEYVKNGGESK